MQLNRREGARIYCACGAEPDAWERPGHATAEEAERCFYDAQVAKGVRWSTQTQASKCAICDEWTPDMLHGGGNLIDPYEHVCRAHFDKPDGEVVDDAAAWLWERHPFTPGIQITASW